MSLFNHSVSSFSLPLHISEMGGGGTNRKGRIAFFDVMKGIGILLVCLGHSIGTMSAAGNRFILSFHMPLFFFISGALLRVNHVETKPFWNIIKRKIFTIIIPQITYGFIGILTSVLIDCIITAKLTLSEVNYIGSFTGWFLPTLFLMEVIIYALLRLSGENKYRMVAGFLIFIVLFYLCNFEGIIQQT